MMEALPLARLDNAALRTLIDAIPTGALVIDDQGMIRAANDVLERLLHCEPGSLPGTPLEQLLPERFRAGHAQLIRRFMAAPARRTMGAGQALFARRQDGLEIPIEIGLNPLETSDGPRVLATLVDLSARRKADLLFRQMVESAPYGILVMDSHGRISLANRQLLAMFGYEQAALEGHGIEMLLPDRYRTAHIQHRDAYALSPEIRKMGPGRDLTAQHRDGTEFPVEIGLSPIEIEGEACTLAAVIDITERKKMELDLRRFNTNLEEFTYVASHDLRSPLRGIGDLLNWVQEDLGEHTPPEVQKNFLRITQRVHRMEQLIDNLLTYARAGRNTGETGLIELPAMLDRIEELIALPPGFRISRQLDALSFPGNPTPLETVLRNLVSNAIKHHDQAEGHIEICATNEGSFCHLSVCDDGPGIPAQAHERIFKLFQTLSSAPDGNSGIGLAVSRRMTESHGGRISVMANTAQRGVTFHVWWPRFLRKDVSDANTNQCPAG